MGWYVSDTRWQVGEQNQKRARGEDDDEWKEVKQKKTILSVDLNEHI